MEVRDLHSNKDWKIFGCTQLKGNKLIYVAEINVCIYLVGLIIDGNMRQYDECLSLYEYE